MRNATATVVRCLVAWCCIVSAYALNDPLHPVVWYSQAVPGGPLTGGGLKSEASAIAVTVHGFESGNVSWALYRRLDGGSYVLAMNISASELNAVGHSKTRSENISPALSPFNDYGVHTYEFQLRKSSDGSVFWNSGAITIQAMKVGEKDSPPPATPANMTYPVHCYLDGCPPREGARIIGSLRLVPPAGQTQVTGQYRIDIVVSGSSVRSYNLDLGAGRGVGAVPIDVNVTGLTLPGEGLLEVKVNGKVITSKSLECGVELVDNTWLFGSYNVLTKDGANDATQVGNGGTTEQTKTTVENPDGTKTTTTTTNHTTNGGSTTTTTNQTTVLPGGSTSMPDMTKQDFYDAVKNGVADALKGQGSSGGGSGSGGGDEAGAPGGQPTFNQPDVSGAIAKEGALKDGVDGMIAQQRNALSTVSGVVDAVQQVHARVIASRLPSGDVGQSLSGFKVSFRSKEYAVNLSRFEESIAWLRKLMVLTVAYVYWRLNILLVLKNTYA